MAGRAKTISESGLLKALEALEVDVAKSGDSLENRDPEGGMSSEGTPMSRTGQKSSKKRRMRKGDEEPPPPKGKDEEEDEEEEDEEEEDDRMAAKKALEHDLAKGFEHGMYEDAADALDAAPFLDGLAKNLTKSLGGVEDKLGSAVVVLAKSVEVAHADRREFEVRSAQALHAIGTTVVGMQKSLAEMQEQFAAMMNQPNVPRRKSVLSKSDVQKPPFEQGGEQYRPGLGAAQLDGGDNAHLASLVQNSLSPEQINKSLNNMFDQARAGQGGADAGQIGQMIIRYDANDKNVSVLPTAVLQRIANEHQLL